MCLNHVIPAAVKYQNVLIENVNGIREIFGKGYLEFCSAEIETLKKISTYINNVSIYVEQLVEARKKANKRFHHGFQYDELVRILSQYRYF
jgi:glutamine synthetase